MAFRRAPLHQSVVPPSTYRDAGGPRYHRAVAQEFDADAMVERFRARAEAVRRRTLPPVEGAERERFKVQAQEDYMDFAIIGDAQASLDDGVLTLRVDLRPPGDRDA